MSGDYSKKYWQKLRDEHEAKNGEEKSNDAEALEQDTEELIEDNKKPNSSGALEHPSYAELEEQLTLAEQKAHENWEKTVRAQAELENVRRRTQRDIESAHRFGLEKFVDSLLPIVDSLEQALHLAEQQDNKAMHEGLELTMKLFLDVLAKHSIEQINPEGEIFDPQLHEAMSMQQSDEAEPNTILNVFQRGYKLHGRIIRPARVIVAKGK
jgi:molecular chaperone GrpE